MIANRVFRSTMLAVLVFCLASTAHPQIASLQATLSLEQINDRTVPFQNGSIVPSFEKQKRPMISLAGVWRKQRFNADHDLTLRRRDESSYAALVKEAGNRFSPYYDDSGWQTKTIPAVENTMNGNERTPEYYENGVWYRTKFSASDSMRGRIARLKFLAVNYVADVWLNGTYIGWHEGGYTPFAFDVSSLIRFDSLNVLAVRVDNVPWSQAQVQDLGTGKRIDIVPYYKVDWFNYTGIMHDVYLEFANPVSVVRADIVPQDINGTVNAAITVQNRGAATGADVSISVYRAAIDSTNVATEYSYQLIGGQAIVSGVSKTTLSIQKDTCSSWQTTLTIANPKLWSPRNPALYIMKVTVTKGGQVIDEFATQFGIRTLRTSGSVFLLNEQPMFFPGIARHEDHPTYGRSMPPAVIYDDLKRIKALNVGFLRSGHYPNNPYTYLMCDRLGIAVMEEIPVWWFDNDEAWLIQNIARNIHTQMFREMVFKDYNRPSVFLWSTCNECLVVPGRETFIRNVNNELNSRYPDGRFVSQSAAADRPGANDASQQACDVAGWTMYFGIFHGGTYYGGTKQFLKNAHAALPNKPIINTEFGCWSASSEGQQVEVFDSTFAALSEVTILDKDGKLRPNGFLMATTWWTAFDWYTSQQPTSYQSMGVMKMNRTTLKQVATRMTNAYAPYYKNSEPTAVEQINSGEIPSLFGLSQNYPNPFNPTTIIRYAIPVQAQVTLKVFDLLGREVATLEQGEKRAGEYAAEWRASGLASGVYVYQLTAGNFRSSHTMVLLK